MSTSGQNKDDPWSSLPRQVEDLRAAAARWGFRVVLEEVEQGSGAKATRPGWQRVLAAVTAGEVDVLMAVATDRLSRSEKMADSEAFRHLAKQLGVRVVTLKQGEMDLSGTADAETRGDFDALLNKRERLVTRERMMDGRKAKGEAGEYTGGGAPYGYQPYFDPTGTKSFPVVEAEAEVVRDIFARYAAGQRVCDIARELRTLGVPAPGSAGARGAHWYDRTVATMLANPTYIGLSSWQRKKGGGGVIPSKAFVPLVEPELWERAQQAAKVSKLRNQRGNAPRNPLAGILRCQDCGRGYGFTGYRPDFLGSYGCPYRGDRHAIPCTGGPSFNAEAAEATVLAYLRKMLPLYLDGKIDAARYGAHQGPSRVGGGRREGQALERALTEAKKLHAKALDKFAVEDDPVMAGSLRARCSELGQEVQRLEGHVGAHKREAHAVIVKQASREGLRELNEELQHGDFTDRAELRRLFDLALKQVYLVKTSKPRCRQTLAVERLELRNGDPL